MSNNNWSFELPPQDTIGSENSRHFFIQSGRNKTKTIVIRQHKFSRASLRLHVFTSSFDRFTGLPAFFVIGLSDNVGFG